MNTPNRATPSPRLNGRPRTEPIRSASSGTPCLSSIWRSAVTPANTPNSPAMNSSSRVVDTCTLKISRELPSPTTTLDSEMVSSNVTWVPVWMNANTRPRTASPTSVPSSVVPARNAIPAPTPTQSAKNTAMTRCHANARMATDPAARMIDSPNQRRRDSAPTSFGPATMPTPRPTNRTAKRM